MVHLLSGLLTLWALLTTVSKPKIACGLVRITAGMVGILLNSCYPRNSMTYTESAICLDEMRTRVRTSYIEETSGKSCDSTSSREPTRFWRYSVGVSPHTSRKTCAKCCCVL